MCKGMIYHVPNTEKEQCGYEERDKSRPNNTSAYSQYT